MLVLTIPPNVFFFLVVFFSTRTASFGLGVCGSALVASFISASSCSVFFFFAEIFFFFAEVFFAEVFFLFGAVLPFPSGVFPFFPDVFFAAGVFFTADAFFAAAVFFTADAFFFFFALFFSLPLPLYVG
jgi:hypothetical protein